jgi:hypothetical protein
MRRLALLGALALIALTGCTAEESGTPRPGGPVKAPRLTEACPLLGAADLNRALGVRFTPEERPSEQAGGGTQYICVYRSSTVDLVLTVSDAPRGAETPARFVSTISGTDPRARKVSGVGTDATFVHMAGGDVRVLLGAAKNSADRFRAVTVALSAGGGETQRPLARLAKHVLSRI